MPVLSIGGDEERGPGQFFQIQNIVIDGRGRLWVADGQSGELRIFHPDGSHWKTRGGRGEGPGEFLRIRLLGSIEGDTVLVGDGGVRRITVFDPNGEMVRTEVIEPGDSPMPVPFDAFSDGSVLGQVPQVGSASDLTQGQILSGDVQLVRVHMDTPSLERYATADGPQWIWTGRSLVPIPFTVNASFDIVGDHVHIVSGHAFRIRVFEGGRLLESYGVERAARRVSEGDVRAYHGFVEEYIQEPRRPEHLAALDHEASPEVLPAYDRVLAGPSGHIWAHVYNADLTAPATWDVYNAQRVYLGTVTFPSNLYVMVIEEEAIVGVWRDELGVEYVRRYELEVDDRSP